MRTGVLPGALAILCALAFAGPADAINIGGTDYTLFAKTNVKMKDGALLSIQGNVGVNDVGGLLRIGAANKIMGAAFADTMVFGRGAKVDNCAFNASTRGDPTAACTEISSTILPITAWPPVPVPVVSVGVLNPICPADGALALAPGNYGDLKVKGGCVLTLSAGTYSFKTLHMKAGSRMVGAGATSTFIHVLRLVVTEPRVTINDASITSISVGTSEAIKIASDSVLNNVRLYAPNARLRLHQGGVYKNFEGIAESITVDPITIGVPASCACAGAIAKSGATILLTAGCGLDNRANTYFLATACEGCFVGAGCHPASPVAGSATATGLSLGTPGGLPVAQYHVIINSPAGSFCTANTLLLP